MLLNVPRDKTLVCLLSFLTRLIASYQRDQEFGGGGLVGKGGKKISLTIRKRFLYDRVVSSI